MSPAVPSLIQRRVCVHVQTPTCSCVENQPHYSAKVGAALHIVCPFWRETSLSVLFPRCTQTFRSPTWWKPTSPSASTAGASVGRSNARTTLTLSCPTSAWVSVCWVCCAFLWEKQGIASWVLTERTTQFVRLLLYQVVISTFNFR